VNETDRPTREVALEWMAETGEGPAAAAREFGVKPATVRSWKLRAQRCNGDAQAPATRKKKKTAPARRRPSRKTKDPGEPPAPPSRSNARGRKGQRRKKVAPLDPATLDRATRRALRNAILERVKYLASPESVRQREQQPAAITLGILTDKFGGVLATIKSEGDEGAQREGAVDRLREALQLDQPTARAEVEEDPGR